MAARRARLQVQEPAISYEVEAEVNIDVPLDVALEGVADSLRDLGNPKVTDVMFSHWVEAPPHNKET